MFGFLTYPTRWFWDGTRTDLFEAGLLGERPTREPKVLLRSTLKGTPFIAFEDGYVAMDSADKMLITRCFNSFFLGLTLLTGSRAEPVTDKVLEKVEINSDDTRILREQPLILAGNFVSAHPQLRRGDRNAMPPYPGLEVRHDAYSTEELKVVLRFAAKLIKRSRPPIAARFLEVREQAATGNLTAALILGWTLVEQVVDAELMGHLIDQGVPLAQAHESVEGMTSFAVIERLRRSKPRAIGSGDPTSPRKGLLLEFDRLRRIRNRVVHGVKPATQRDVNRMTYAAERAMWRTMRQDRVDYQAFLDRIAPLQTARNERLRH